MSYEHNFDEKIVVFPDEENYLKCKLAYLEYEKGFEESETHFSFLEYIQGSWQSNLMGWVVEEIKDNDTAFQTYTFSVDWSDSANDSWSSSSYTNTTTESSQSVVGDDGTIVGFNGETLYTTLVLGSTNTTDLHNGWIRTDSTHRYSTDTPEEQEKKRKKNEFDRFDILDFD